MRIGVIGSGISGLTVSRLLIEAEHDVVLFERQSSPGIDAHSVNLYLGDNSVRADVPSRMFNTELWPTLTQFYERIGIQGRNVDMSQCFSALGGNSYLNLSDAIHPRANPLQLLRPSVRELLAEASRLRDQGQRDLDSGIDPDLTFGQYLSQNKFPVSFIRKFLYPTLSSTVFTCSYESLDAYPAVVLLDALHKLNRSQQLNRVQGGSRQVVTKLSDMISDTRFDHSVQRVREGRDGVEVEFIHDSKTETSVDTFDHVIMATQANTSARLLPDLPPKEKRILEAFTYETIPIFVHHDEALMPADRKSWGTFNMITNAEETAAMCTVWLNRFHDDWNVTTPVFQTINAFTNPVESSIYSQCTLQRPVVNQDSKNAVHEIARCHSEANRRIWFCGSFASEGTPLLESGVVSAHAVAASLQAACEVGCG